MLANTISVGSNVTLTKVNDNDSGTLYIDTAGGLNPLSITIRHNSPGLGKKGTAQHNVKVRIPLTSSEVPGVLNGLEQAVINFTINCPTPLLSAAPIYKAIMVLNLLLQADTTTPVVDTGTTIMTDLLLNKQ